MVVFLKSQWNLDVDLFSIAEFAIKECSLDVHNMCNAAACEHKRKDQLNGHSICDRRTDTRCIVMLSLYLLEASNIDSSSKLTAALLFHDPYCVYDLDFTGKFATLHSLKNTTLNHSSIFCSNLFFPFF